MKLFKYLIGLTAVLLLSTACKEEAAQEAEVPEPQGVSLDSLEDRVSYLMGYSVAKQVEESGLKINKDAIVKAIEDAQSGADSMISEQELRQTGTEFQRLIQEKRASSAKESNLVQGEEYRKQNAERAGVQQTASGIQYEVLVAAKQGAKKPTTADQVKVNYHGTLIDGKVFDSSIDKGRPVTFGVTQVIAGWTEVLQLMSEGEKWRVVIPGELAYPNGTRSIPPGATLIFEIELLEINPDE